MPMMTSHAYVILLPFSLLIFINTHVLINILGLVLLVISPSWPTKRRHVFFFPLCQFYVLTKFNFVNIYSFKFVDIIYLICLSFSFCLKFKPIYLNAFEQNFPTVKTFKLRLCLGDVYVNLLVLYKTFRF